VKFFVVFVFGAVIGSFLNVCIYRIPLGKSIIRPRSHCPLCGKPVRALDNVPLLSFLLLKGRCRGCGGKIPVRYFVVELITALSGVILLWFFPEPPRFIGYSVFVCVLIMITFIDLEHQLVPDVLSIPGIFAGLVFSAFFADGRIGFSFSDLLGSLGGALAGAVSIFLMGIVGEAFFRQKAEKAGGAVGGGDLKLMAMIGAFLGWELVILTFFLAPFSGSVLGLYALIRKKSEVVAYAPHIALGAFISLLWGNRIIGFLFPSV